MAAPDDKEGGIRPGEPPYSPKSQHGIREGEPSISIMRSGLNRPTIFFVIGGFVAILIASFLPMWTLWHENPCEGLGRPVSLWSLIWNTLIDPPAINPAFPVTTSGDKMDAVTGGVIFTIGAFLGLVTYYLKTLAPKK